MHLATRLRRCARFHCLVGCWIRFRADLRLRHSDARRRKFEQGFAIDLSVIRERQLRKKDEGRRDHVIGQLRFERAAQSADRLGSSGLGHQIGNQALVALPVFANDDDSLPDSGALLQDGFNLARFDAVAAKLDLVVGAAKKLDVPVRQKARKVAGAIDATR